MPKIVTSAYNSPASRQLRTVPEGESSFRKARSKFVFGSPVMHHSPNPLQGSTPAKSERSTPAKSKRSTPAKRSRFVPEGVTRRSTRGQLELCDGLLVQVNGVKIRMDIGQVVRRSTPNRTSAVARWLTRQEKPWSADLSTNSDDDLLASPCDISSDDSEKCYSITYAEESAVTIEIDDEVITSDDEPFVPKVKVEYTENVVCQPDIEGSAVVPKGRFGDQKKISNLKQPSENRVINRQFMTWFDPSMTAALKDLATALAGQVSSRFISPPTVVNPLQRMIQFKVHAPRYTNLTPVMATKGSSPLIAEMVSHITRLPHSHVKLTLPNGEKLQIISQDTCWPCGDKPNNLDSVYGEKLSKEDKGTSTTEDESMQSTRNCTFCHRLNEEITKLNDEFRCRIGEAELQLDNLRQRLAACNSKRYRNGPLEFVRQEGPGFAQSKRREKRPPLWTSSTPRERKRSNSNSPLVFENSKVTKKTRNLSLSLSANRKKKVPKGIISGEQSVVTQEPVQQVEEDVKQNADESIRQLNQELEMANEEKSSLQMELNNTKSQLEETLSLHQRTLQNELIQLRERNQLLTESYQAEKVARKRYFTMLEDAKGKIRVYCRIKPCLPSENETNIVESVDDFTVALSGVRGRQEFQFDHVFTSRNTQEDVFAVAKDMVDLAYEGYNVCIFAYGQTGSGKTYTLLGDPHGKDPGIASRAFLRLFQRVEENGSTQESIVHISAMELYNEKLLDLLHPQGVPEEKLEIRKESNGMVTVFGCKSKRVDKPSDLLAIFHEACARRHVASTKMNNRSSRSHLIVTLLVESTNKLSGTVSRGKFSLVDLAGSERQSKLDTIMAQLKEANSINKSLSALGDVIAALASEQLHVPYRNNKLTLLMQDSLGGNAKTLMFVNVSPDHYNLEETTSSLHYAARVKQIKNDPFRITESKEIARLKAIITRLRKGDNVNES